jgi:hypothetical protein
MGGTVEGEVCNTTDDRCVECLQNSDCKNANRPICNTAHDFCVQCVTNADCGDAGQTCSALGVCQ